MTDLRHAFRSLRRTPGFTAIAVVSLSLGIGACTAVAAVLDVLMFRGRGISDAEQVVEIYAAEKNGGRASDMLPAERWEVWRETDFRSFDGLAAQAPVSATIGMTDARRLRGAAVSRDFFAVTRARLHIGRALLSEDHAAGARVLVLGYGAWLDRLGGDDGVIGRSMQVNGETYTVIGVAAREFGYPAGAAFWIPLRSVAAAHAPPAVTGVARLADGVMTSAAESEVRLRSMQELAADSTRFGGMAAAALPLSSTERGGKSQALLALAGVILVFLVGLANLASMFLMRILSRSSEFAVRRALGASALRLVQPLVAEAALLSFAGLAGGCWIAFVTRGWAGSLLIANYSSALEPGLTVRVIAVAAVIALLTVFVLTLVPLRAARNADVRGALQAGAVNTTMTRGQQRWRQALVGAQVCLAFLLVVGAVAMTRAFQNFQSFDVGYDAAQVLTLRPDLAGTGYEDFVQARLLSERLAEAVRLDPDVEAAGLWRGISIGWPPRPEHTPVQEGLTEPLQGRRQLWHSYDVSPDVFQTIGVDIVRGRGFTDIDAAGAPLVAIVTEDAARYWWPGEDALGKRVKLGRAEPWLTIVGIARSMSELHNLARDWTPRFRQVGFSPMLFRPLAQADRLPQGWRDHGTLDANGIVLAVRTARPAEVAPRLLAVLHEIAPGVEAARPTTLLEQQTAAWNGPELRFNSRFLTVFAALSLFLGLLGVAGMVAGSVRTRTREIGIRMALGASPVRLVAGIARGSLFLAGAGLLAGGLLATTVHWLLSREYGFYTYAVLDFGGVEALPLIAATAAVFSVVACAAVAGARRATEVDPMVALRVE